MNLRNPWSTNDRGIALIIVMMVVVVLGVLAAGFAYSMKVETKLARNVSHEGQLEWLGRSGVELARYVLAQQKNIPGEQGFDALNQVWAGGPPSTNELLMGIHLLDNELGQGSFSVRITDLERKFNINLATPAILQRAVDLLQVDSVDAATIVDSIEDWKDPLDDPHVSGTESDYYLGLPEPYVAKNGPLDHLSELLLIRGITPSMYWGAASPGLAPAEPVPSPTSVRFGPLASLESQRPRVGFVDLFCTLGRLQVNVNTASPDVLLLLPGMDENLARGIVLMRAGPDGVDGTEDDTPLHSPGELINVPGMIPLFVQQLQAFASVQSFTFEVRVDVTVDQYHRTFVALLTRLGSRNVQILNSHWD